MWILLPFGFFSIVSKPGDQASGMLTVRARAAADLDALRDQHLPELDATVAHAGTDYPYRARAPRAAVARLLSTMATDLDYDNFKDAVARVDRERAHLYHDVWSVLRRIERPKAVTR